MWFDRRLAWLCLLAGLLLFVGPGAAEGGREIEDADLVAALRAGGLNIYFRHAETDWSQSDNVTRAGDWLSCDGARIRQLSTRGREVASRIGRAMRALDIPVGTVLASPYCRTRETAELLGLGPVISTTEVMNLRVAEYFGGRDAIVSTARALLARAPPAGTHTVIVAHGNVAREATPVYPGEAEAVAFRPNGSGGFEVLARITPEEWSRLARRYAVR